MERKKVQYFEDLFIWQLAIEFAVEIYELTEKAGLRNDFGLKKQMRDSAVSISSNIAEGFERRSRKEYLNFLNIAKGSAGETRSQLHVAFRVGYIGTDEFTTMRERAKFVSGSIANHIASISIADPPTP